MITLRPTAATTALAAAAIAGVLVAVPAASASAGTPSRSFPDGGAAHAVFVQNDDPAGNAVIAYHRSPSGALTQVGEYPTGGLGGVLGGSAVDHLASEGSLGYDAGLLVAVNAGSDTITTFAATGDHLTAVQTLPSGGSFPVSVAVRGDRVFVLDARDGGAVQGYLRVGDHLVLVPGWHRSLGLDPQQKPEFTSTPGQISFTPDGDRLVVTTKNGSNSVLVYDVTPFGLSSTPAVTSLPGTVPFGFAFSADGLLALTEAGTNSVATFRIAPDGHLVPVDSAATGQAATCWAVATRHAVYASNAGSATLSGYGIDPDGSLQSLGTTGTDKGTVDAAVTRSGRFLYVQTGAAGIVDEYAVGHDGTLSPIGSVTVPNGAGGEGIVAR